MTLDILGVSGVVDRNRALGVVFACTECGGPNVQVTAWVYPNEGDRMAEGDAPNDDAWCDDCQSETGIEFIDVMPIGSGVWARVDVTQLPVPPKEGP